jgi:hypothetical protein
MGDWVKSHIIADMDGDSSFDIRKNLKGDWNP